MTEIVEKNGKYYTQNPSSKNLKKLSIEETKQYLLSKERLSETDLLWHRDFSGEPAMFYHPDHDGNSLASEMTDEDLMVAANFYSESYGDDAKRLLIENPPRELRRKAILQEAYDRGVINAPVEESIIKELDGLDEKGFLNK